jgi:hypothetical protein
MINKHVLATKIFAFSVHAYLYIIYHTCRLRTLNLETVRPYSDEGKNIFAFWHGRMLYPVYYYSKNIKKPKTSILISQSRDGDFGDALVHRFQQHSIRGSSSRGGFKAIHQLADRLGKGYNLALTPDGPRGPAFQARVGIIKLAQFTGARIIPMTFSATRKITLNSWDKFIIPLPFSQIYLAFGDPFFVPSDSTSREITHYRQHLETTLLELDRQCETRFRETKT